MSSISSISTWLQLETKESLPSSTWAKWNIMLLWEILVTLTIKLKLKLLRTLPTLQGSTSSHKLISSTLKMATPSFSLLKVLVLLLRSTSQPRMCHWSPFLCHEHLFLQPGVGSARTLEQPNHPSISTQRSLQTSQSFRRKGGSSASGSLWSQAHSFESWSSWIYWSDRWGALQKRWLQVLIWSTYLNYALERNRLQSYSAFMQSYWAFTNHIEHL